MSAFYDGLIIGSEHSIAAVATNMHEFIYFV